MEPVSVIQADPNADPAELARALRTGASSDIWYDAATYGDESNDALIDNTKIAMESAALVVERCGELKRMLWLARRELDDANDNGHNVGVELFAEIDAVLAGAKPPPLPPSAPLLYKLAVVFGVEDTRAVEEGEAKMASLDTYAVKEFASIGELNAYRAGLEDGNGWEEYATVALPGPASPDAPAAPAIGTDPFMEVEPTHALQVLREVHKQYGRLHDMLSDCIENGRLTEAMLPDDYRALADQLYACVATDHHVKEAMKDTASAALDQREMLVHAAFVVEGLRAANYDKVIDAWHEGAIELHDALMFHVPAINAARMAADAAGALYPGVFDYEVSTCFGRWCGKRIIETGFMPPQNEAVGYICGAVQTFFSDHGQHVDRKLNAAIDAAVRPFLIEEDAQ